MSKSDVNGGLMCVCWPQICVASHVLCSITYTVVGAIQLIAGIFFFFSLPVFKIGSNIWTGVWNVVAGVGGAVFSCVGDLNANKQQMLLYLTISVLVLNVINLVVLELGEWRILLPDNVKAIIEKQNLQTLVLYARMMTSISTGVAVFTSFFDSQFMFCWLERKLKPRSRLDHNETVSDIEYIIPRVKSGSNNSQGEAGGRTTGNSHNVYNQYAQSWVFDTDTVGSSQSDSPYSKLQQFNGSKTVVLKRKNKRTDCGEQIANTVSTTTTTTTTKSKSQPMVLVEGTAADTDRQLHFMTSFSRTPSPVGRDSDSSTPASGSSPSSDPPMIYKCLERLTEPSVYKSRLNTALVINSERSPPCVSPRPHSVVISDQVQYASLMVELEKTIVAKFPSRKTPDVRSESGTGQSSRRASSRDDTSPFQHGRPGSSLNQSDTDFSKELEAALQLIQDLESPNTTELPSDHPVSLSTASYRPHGDDEPSKPRCLISQMTEGSTGTPEMRSGSGSGDGKKNDESKFCYLHHSYCNDCYYIKLQEQNSHSKSDRYRNDLSISKNHNVYFDNDYRLLLPNKKTYDSDMTSSNIKYDDIDINESENDDDCNSLGNNFNLKDGRSNSSRCSNKSNSNGDNNISKDGDSDNNYEHENNNYKNLVVFCDDEKQVGLYREQETRTTNASVFGKMKSLLKTKGQARQARRNKKLILTPELENAILKSESLVHLSEVELVQRYNRNKTLQRKIEEKVTRRQINDESSNDSSEAEETQTSC